MLLKEIKCKNALKIVFVPKTWPNLRFHPPRTPWIECVKAREPLLKHCMWHSNNEKGGQKPKNGRSYMTSRKLASQKCGEANAHRTILLKIGH